MLLNDVKTGDVFLLLTRGPWYSAAIAWFMGKTSRGISLSHCGVVRAQSPEMGPITLETSDYEATYGALEKYTRHPEKYHLQVYRMPEGTWASAQHLEDALRTTDAEFYGKIYGYFQLLSLGLRRLLMRVGVKIPNFFRGGQVCTAVSLRFLGYSEDTVFHGVDPEAYDTVEFAEMLYASGARMIFESGSQ